MPAELNQDDDDETDEENIVYPPEHQRGQKHHSFYYHRKKDRCPEQTQLSSLKLDQMPSLLQLMMNTEFEPQRQASRVSLSMLKQHMEGIGFDLPNLESQTYKSMSLIRLRHAAYALQTPSQLPRVLRDYHKGNPGVYCSFQQDSDGCFYRMMVSVPNVLEVFHNLCLPMLQGDGCHMKCPYYDGIIFKIVGKYGDGSVCPLFIAYVPDGVFELTCS